MNDELMQQLQALTQVDGLDIPGAIEAEEPEEFQPPVIKEVTSHPSERVKDLETDYATVRDNAHFQQQLLRMAAMKAFENASMSDAPRMMEVFATLMTQMTNNNKQILDIQKQMKDITQQEIATTQGGGGTVQSINAETAVFVGNARDLLNEVGSRQEYLRSKREEEIIDVEPEEVQKEDD